MINQSFIIANMPSTRPADYYLGYLDSVFLDFDNYGEEKVKLIRISFDGYGCCELGENSIPLSNEDSIRFKEIIKNEIEDQDQLLVIVKQSIRLNDGLIWRDALEEYNLI